MAAFKMLQQLQSLGAPRNLIRPSLVIGRTRAASSGTSDLPAGLVRLKNEHVRPKSTFSGQTAVSASKVPYGGFIGNSGADTDEKAAAAASAADAAFAAGPGHFKEWMINLRGEDIWLAQERGEEWFTGKVPKPGVCPGVTSDGRIQSLPLPNLKQVTRQATQEYFDNTWALMETLWAGLKGEEPFYRPPVHGLRHPHIFYYGHSPCLYVNKLRVAGVLEEPINAYFESIFEVGVDEMLWDDMHKNDMVWPTVAEVHEYRKQVYKAVSNVIATHPSLDDGGGAAPVTITWDHPLWSLFMGFEHERIHFETSSVLFREMPERLLQLPKNWPSPHPSAERAVRGNHKPLEGLDFPVNEMVSVKGCSVELGKPRDFPSYGWDNEYGSRTVEVPDFAASKYLITNGEFWHFVDSGGYRTRSYWSEDGWGWRTFRNAKWPFFWKPDGPEGSMRFRLRTIFETKDMQWDWPVDVNYHEAKAYCAWRSEREGLLKDNDGYRVITEAEHHLIRGDEAQMARARENPMSDRAMWAGGDIYSAAEPGSANLNLAFSTQCPVNALPASTSGHHDAMGNAWEWTEDHFNPLDGFEVHRVYDDFSAPCFDGRHHMIMGGSFASSGDNGASIFCRYHFRPHFLQHSSFRLVHSSSPVPCTRLNADGSWDTPVSSDVSRCMAAPAHSPATLKEGGESKENIYETTELVDMYLGFHFPSSAPVNGEDLSLSPILHHPGAPDFALRFPQRMARLLASLCSPHSSGGGRALDVGCAVGGSSFELAAAGFDEVVGIDFSHAFVEAAQRMQRGEAIRFGVPMEGALRAEVQAQHEPGPARDSEVRNRISFRQGDACRMLEEKEALGTFDAVLLANLLCRLPEPLACLDGLSMLVRPGGTALIVTPFSWLEEFTEKSKWLGGFQDPSSSARRVWSKDRLKLEMESRGFVKVHEEQVPLIIREHQRKYQYIVSEASGWRRS